MGHALVWKWWLYQSDWSSHFLGSCMMRALYQSIQLPSSNSYFVTLEHIANSNRSWAANAFLPWPAKFRSSLEQRSNWVQNQRLTFLRSLLCHWCQYEIASTKWNFNKQWELYNLDPGFVVQGFPLVVLPWCLLPLQLQQEVAAEPATLTRGFWSKIFNCLIV